MKMKVAVRGSWLSVNDGMCGGIDPEIGEMSDVNDGTRGDCGAGVAIARSVARLQKAAWETPARL